ncbi:hypothetical protein FDG2_3282 [Candidatus Protofrankia californiensis]|uniref:HTH luxR-type domain-containing protein n=1 Tax=Candidatus Protofrankia californiensis TaxID=1839754 RepID=A0A1C3NZA6_9ACTN|nr:hypothetical protein FDG2_3282 [Candidatus Protofrankia californiensis]
MSYPAAAQFLRAAVPGVIRSYRDGLRAVRSPLSIGGHAWPMSHDQALAILEDCIAELAGEQSRGWAEAKRNSRLVGMDRALHGIHMAESLRAVEILWSAMQPTVRAAIKYEVPARRTSVLLLVSNAFRVSAGIRIYAEALGYFDVIRRTPEDVVDSEDKNDRQGSAVVCTAAYMGLSQREREILDGVTRALTNRQIAQELGIKTATVKRHLNNIYGKLQAVSRVDAVNKAFGRVHSGVAL